MSRESTGDMEILVRKLNGDILLELTLPPTCCIQDIKIKISSSCLISPYVQRLSMGESPLHDSTTLEALRLQGQPAELSFVRLAFSESEGPEILHSSQYGTAAEVDTNLRRLANPNAAEGNGRTPLSYAITRQKLDIVNALCAALADISGKESNRHSPLMHAAAQGSVEIVRHLIEVGADHSRPGLFGWTPVHVAVRERKVDVLRFLCTARADCDTAEDNGCTPLHSACEMRGSHEAIDLLCSNGVNTEAVHRGCTPLQRCLFIDNRLALRYLCEFKADVDAVMSDGDTALLHACRRCSSEQVEILCAAGADRDFAGMDGKNARDIAEQSVTECSRLLSDRPYGLDKCVSIARCVDGDATDLRGPMCCIL